MPNPIRNRLMFASEKSYSPFEGEKKPAEAGFFDCHSRVGGNPAWVPAYAGTTII